jgi:hypothetical protein
MPHPDVAIRNKAKKKAAPVTGAAFFMFSGLNPH